MLKERLRHTFANPIKLKPSDLLQCTVSDRETTQVFSERIGREVTIDTVVTFDVVDPILGLSDGIGAIFGRAE